MIDVAFLSFILSLGISVMGLAAQVVQVKNHNLGRSSSGRSVSFATDSYCP